MSTPYYRGCLQRRKVTNRKNRKAADKKTAASTQNEFVKCDLEFWRVEKDLIELLTTPEIETFRTCIKKIEQMTWLQVMSTSSKTQKRGLNWEVLNDQETSAGRPIATIRVNAKFRARVTRDGVFMRFISLHPDHDSAYKEQGGEKL